MSAREIREQIGGAILDLRLNPGAKLAEQRLAEIFSVSRAQIRSVLSHRALERLVELVPQRGAFVAKPSPQGASEIIEARRTIEHGVFNRLMDTLTQGHLYNLRQHVQQELDADNRNDQHSMIRLAADFHLLAADLAGNAFLARTLRELVPLTGLCVLLYSRRTPACSCHEHHRIVEALARCDRLDAHGVIEHHLNHIYTGLRSRSGIADIDLETIFNS